MTSFPVVAAHSVLIHFRKRCSSSGRTLFPLMHVINSLFACTAHLKFGASAL